MSYDSPPYDRVEFKGNANMRTRMRLEVRADNQTFLISENLASNSILLITYVLAQTLPFALTVSKVRAILRPMRSLSVMILLVALVLLARHASASPPIDISAEELKTLHTRAAQGNADAQYNLGTLYEKGQSVPQDYATARRWYEQAAAQGNADAQGSLGILYRYRDRQGVQQDYSKARQWWDKAAAQGVLQAQNNLGLLYYNGQSVQQDYSMARQWWVKAATQGDAEAQNNLGTLYAFGRGVPQDYAKAREWYKKAAVQGFATAQSQLGWLYRGGQGVPQDDVRAYMWFNVAAPRSMGDLQKSEPC